MPNFAKTLKRKDFNRFLYPIRALKCYVKQTESVRKGRNRLFLPIKGNHDINKGFISGWISSVIRLAYKDLSKKKLALLNIRAHKVRALATSWAYFSKTLLKRWLGLQFGQITQCLQNFIWEIFRSSHRIFSFWVLWSQPKKSWGEPTVLPATVANQKYSLSDAWTWPYTGNWIITDVMYLQGLKWWKFGEFSFKFPLDHYIA